MIAAALVIVGALGPCAALEACRAKLRTTPELLPAAKAALAMVHLPEGEPKQPPAKLKPSVLRGDEAFSIEIEQQGEELIVRALSLHRPPSLYGRARATPQALPKPAQRERAVQIALRGAIERAMEDLSAQLAEAAGQGKRSLKLSVRVSGLDRTSREQVRDVYLPCLKGQFDGLGPVTEPRELAGYLEDQIEYAPEKDEPRDSLSWQAERLRTLSLGMKAKCPAPPKLTASFRADSVGRGVIIELR